MGRDRNRRTPTRSLPRFREVAKQPMGIKLLAGPVDLAPGLAEQPVGMEVRVNEVPPTKRRIVR